MKKILFVTNRNILTTCGELRLIKNRAEALYKGYGVTTDFIALSSECRIKAEKHEEILAGGKVKIFPLSRSNPLKAAKAYSDVLKYVLSVVKSKKYDCVVLSGLLMPVMARKISLTGTSVVFDIHGAIEDTKAVVEGAGLIKKVVFNALYILEDINLRYAFRYAEGCFVVTKALEDYLIGRFHAAQKSKFYIVPCSTSGNDMSAEEYAEYRKRYRNKYGITNEKVFVYSGGISVWQCVEETIELYDILSKKIKQPTKLLIFSHDIKKIESMIGENKDIILDSYQPIELGKALCAADIAFLLRKKCPTNRVAFPNKFLEYIKSGLYIIATPNVEEIAVQVKKYNVGTLYKMDRQIEGLVEKVQAYTNSVYKAEKVKEIIYNNSFEKRLKTFVRE